jgi:hypothetical protein
MDILDIVFLLSVRVSFLREDLAFVSSVIHRLTSYQFMESGP